MITTSTSILTEYIREREAYKSLAEILIKED